LVETRGEIEKIRSLMVNQGLDCINPKPMIKVQKELKFRVKIGVQQGLNCTKSKVYG
jgi:hypothetical protein